MKAVIVCASTHHGNTRKLVDAIAKEYDVDIIDSTKVAEADLSDYDLIGFASGIYAAHFHQSILAFMDKNLPGGKKIFFICTSAMKKDFTKQVRAKASEKGCEVVGAFNCMGYNTFGPFKLVGGTAKGHPDATDISNVLAFYKGLQ